MARSRKPRVKAKAKAKPPGRRPATAKEKARQRRKQRRRFAKADAKATTPTLFRLTIQPNGTENDEKFCLEGVKASDSIRKVKAKLRNFCGPQVRDQCLSFRGEEMEDIFSLEDFGIRRRVMLVWVLTENGLNDIAMFDMFGPHDSSSSSSS